MVRSCLVSSVFLLAAGIAYSQPAAKSAPSGKPWVVSRTPDGHPDLQGFWSSASITPLQRPKELGAKEFFTAEEASEHDKKEFTERTSWDRLGNQATVHYDMSQFGLDVIQAKVALSRRTSLIIGPEGRIPPMTPEAQKRQAARAAERKGHEFDSAEARPLQERCIVWSAEGPPMMSTGYNSNLEIVQGPGNVTVMMEMIHDARMIPTDGRPHLPASIRQLLGDSRGHWEGDTLVVDTTNFTDKTSFMGSTENLHVVERFTRIDEDTILYEFTVSDPATWIKSWTAQMPLSKIAGPLFEYACHEGNLGMPNTLSGARAAEQEKSAK